jgi:formamidopyrimidine-DNA glycosylase
MPELPEIETTKRGIAPFLLQQTIANVIVRQPQLRWPITPNLSALCSMKDIVDISRRAKYLIIHLSEGFLLIHLGMSGHLRIVKKYTPIGKHDHVDLCLNDGSLLRYNDPRRFGAWLYLAEEPAQHRLLNHLGPEPLTEAFHSKYLYQRARGKTQCIKSFIMDNKIVVGVGNIYATESLFLAGIHPQTMASMISEEQMSRLTAHIKTILQQAIDVGGTTLRDFYAVDGKPGYFANKLNVYGRQHQLCYTCKTLIQAMTIAGRNSAFCPQCQPLCS